MEENLVFYKAYGSECECYGREHIETLGYHSEDGCDGGHNAFFHCFTIHKMALYEKNCSYGKYDYTG